MGFKRNAAAICMAVPLLAPIGVAFAGDASDYLKGRSQPPLKIKTLGSFAYGGTTITGANGDTFHGEAGYAHYVIPENAGNLPIVMWHGGGQFKRTWETT